MCGRFAFFQEIEPLVDDLDAVDLADPHLRSRWNIPPTAPIYVVTESVDKETGEVVRALRIARWGLLPPFAKEASFSSRTFNARRETLAEKPSFRGSLGRYRAIVPMDGYYEWVRDAKGTRKQPYFISSADGSSLFMAALVSWWKGPGGHEGPAATSDGEFLLSATIITRAATGELAEIHDRTPVMLPRDQLDAWLDTTMDDRHDAEAWVQDDSHLLDDATLSVREVDPAVGKVGNDGPELLEGPQRLL
ncbi:SOS response-associated peptidase [Brachybacterium aquaticum]|uniref:Abasic site processing protein n=1 Tax=Brachybacterium aquaticum TaxID=1432564 RepID=A0A841ABG4_9MICO|nr:SOS response-associated peptidase [Brachybacterium aquaticum]MBB5830961.1 putative SOS response-associated peptidase YedK [Brachybacterium aquaticum]